MALYSKEVMKHFKTPQNVGKMENADGLGKVGNLRCGDIMYLYLKIVKNKKGKEVIKDVKFETFGCTVAIANTSLLTTVIKGKTLEEALRVTKDDLVKKFGNVPMIKVHCSMLAVDALSEAIYDYFLKNKRPISEELQKRHEAAEKIGKEIEHRHGELVELEEELHKE
ncbi:MAG: iron-sulfur cluster assembly scaffold protein [bacterium]|nr:iron-sulfur cluster assembly scaffold protein [bacterium]